MNSNTEEYHYEMKKLHDRFRDDMETEISSKDSQIRSMEEKISLLKRQSDEEEGRYNTVREEHMHSKLENNNVLTDLTHTLRKKEQDLGDLKHQH